MRPVRLALLSAVGLTLAAADPSAAQERTGRPDAFFMERSRIFNRVPTDDLAFEGQIAPHLFIVRQDPWGAGEVFSKPITSFAWVMTPLIRLRMFSTESFPVRTPSYMPRPLDFQFLRTSLADTATALREEFAAPLRVWGMTITPWAHHSNGQNGCLFADQSQDPVSGECSDPEERAGVPEPNRVNGSFSTNFARLALGYSWYRLEDRDTRMVGSERCTYQASVEYHPGSWGPGSLSDEQAEFYPRIQATVAAEWGAPLRGQLTIGGEARWLDSPAPDVPSWAHTATVDWMPDGLQGWGLFGRWYSGMDYYNLGFMDRIDYLQIGVVWDIGAVPDLTMGEINPMQALPRYPRSPVLDGGLPSLLDAACRAVH